MPPRSGPESVVHVPTSCCSAPLIFAAAAKRAMLVVHANHTRGD